MFDILQHRRDWDNPDGHSAIDDMGIFNTASHSTIAGQWGAMAAGHDPLPDPRFDRRPDWARRPHPLAEERYYFIYK